MKRVKFFCQSLLMLCLLLGATSVLAQSQLGDKQYQPEVGQAGKDVVWVPTAQALVNKMLDLAKMTPQDYVIDLGSGDGRTVITAARRGARALGIEYNPEMVELSRRNAAKAGVSEKAQFIQGDLFESDFSQATVITMFLLPDINLKLRPRILDMKPGTRVVSNSFTMAEWQEDQKIATTVEDGCDNYFCEAYLWILPAKVAGTWKLPKGELTLKQSFQMITGALKTGSRNTEITNGRMAGEQISFTAGDAQYTGRVSGNTMQGTFKAGGKTASWEATRPDK